MARFFTNFNNTMSTAQEYIKSVLNILCDLSASEMTYIVSSGALNSTHSLCVT